MTSFDQYVSKATQGHVFSKEEMAACILSLMQGQADETQAATFLKALADRGETADEIAGAAQTMRSLATTINAPENAIDCCGTGGDGAHTYNISTAVALVAAGCGVIVAKHGNRAASSKSGTADVLEKLGVNLDMDKSLQEKALREIGFCFMMATNHHLAMKNVANVRKTLGRRTIFNLLGPLSNPAGTKKQLIGVYDAKLLVPIAQALKSLGTQKAMIVYGEDGLDEITLTGKTHAAILDNGTITQKIFTPEDFGLSPIDGNDIKGSDPETNAAALTNVLIGAKNAYRAIVLANAAAVLFLHNGTPFKDGVQRAEISIDSGAALSILQKYKELGR